MNNEPFDERTVLDHLNTELVRYLDPHCILVIKFPQYLRTTSPLSPINSCASLTLKSSNSLDNIEWAYLRVVSIEKRATKCEIGKRIRKTKMKDKLQSKNFAQREK